MYGDGRAALELLQEMNHSGICPTSVTFTSVLSACSHSGFIFKSSTVRQRSIASSPAWNIMHVLLTC